MRVEVLKHLGLYRCFESAGPFKFGSVNLLVGPNNSGKTSLLSAILGLQEGFPWRDEDIRRGAPAATLAVQLSGVAQLQMGSGGSGQLRPGSQAADVALELQRNGQKGSLRAAPDGKGGFGIGEFSSIRSGRCFTAFLGARRPADYDSSVNGVEVAATRDLRSVGGLVGQLSQATHPRHKEFADACVSMLGVEVNVGPAANGQLPGVWGETPNGDVEFISLPSLGAGVAHAIGFLAEIATTRDRVFIIEEPETELHPGALRALLRLIESSAEHNQFFISTHSSLVVRHLGGLASARVFEVAAEKGVWPPTSHVEEVPPDRDARADLLLSLGYEPTELAAYEAWLFFEESSLERLVAGSLLPWFVPELVGIARTVSSAGADRTADLVEDFWRMLLYTHLEKRYQGRAWAFLDGDSVGLRAKEKLETKFQGDEFKGHFRCWTASDAESFLPGRFQADVETIRGIGDRQQRRAAKRRLWERVWDWIEENSSRAREEFEDSAAEVIDAMRQTARELAKARGGGAA